MYDIEKYLVSMLENCVIEMYRKVSGSRYFFENFRPCDNDILLHSISCLNIITHTRTNIY